MNSPSLPFNVQVAAPVPAPAVNKPGDSLPSAQFTQLVDPQEQATWTFAGGVIKRNGVVVPQGSSGTPTRLYLACLNVRHDGPNGIWVWDVTKKAFGPWVGTAVNGKDGPPC